MAEENPFAQFAKVPQEEGNPFAQFVTPSEYAPTPQAEHEVTKDESWYQDPMMATRAFLDGQTFGWSDEIGAAVVAGVAKIAHGDERPYSEIYGDVHGLLQQQRDDYYEEFPVASTALELVGAIASPAMRAKGPAWQVGAAQGGLYGAGTAKEGERLEGAGVGVALGGATGALFQTAAKGLNIISRRKVAQDLGRGEDFIPLQIAGDASDKPGQAYETFLTTFYRDIVGKTFGGRSKLLSQEDRIISNTTVARERTKEALDKTVRNASQSIKEGKKVLKNEFKTISRGAAAVQNAGREAAEEARGDIASDFATKTANIKTKAALDVDRAVTQAQADFRAKAVAESIPDGTPPEAVAEILEMRPNEAMSRIDDLWKTKGFEMISDRDFDINPNAVAGKINKMLDDDPAAQLVVMTSGMPLSVKEIVDQFLQKHVTDGRINGKALSELRSQMGSIASSVSDAGGQQAGLGRVLGNLQEVLNDVVYDQLDDAGKKAFDAQRKQWQHNMALRRSVANASVKAGRYGSFTPDEWLSSVKSLSPAQLRRGEGVLQGEANRIGVLSQQRDKMLNETADQLLNQAQKDKVSKLTGIKKNLQRQKTQKLREVAEAERKMKAGEAKMAYQKGKKYEINALEQQMNSLDSQVETLKQVGLAKNVSTFERLFASGILGFGYGTTNLVSGTVLGRALSSQGAQRVMAGQSGLQEAAQRGMPAIQQALNPATSVTARLLAGE